MLDILHRESVYLWYYFELQLRQIFPYWVLGMTVGSVISVFGKGAIHSLFGSIQGKKLGALKIVLGAKHFALYLAFVALFSLATGMFADLILPF